MNVATEENEQATESRPGWKEVNQLLDRCSELTLGYNAHHGSIAALSKTMGSVQSSCKVYNDAIVELQDEVAKLKRQLHHLCDDLILIRPPRSKRRWRFWE